MSTSTKKASINEAAVFFMLIHDYQDKLGMSFDFSNYEISIENGDERLLQSIEDFIPLATIQNRVNLAEIVASFIYDKVGMIAKPSVETIRGLHADYPAFLNNVIKNGLISPKVLDEILAYGKFEDLTLCLDPLFEDLLITMLKSWPDINWMAKLIHRKKRVDSKSLVICAKQLEVSISYLQNTSSMQ